MSLLNIVRRVTARLSISRPLNVIGNEDPQVVQLLELANEEGEELRRVHEWSGLITPWEFQVTSDPFFIPLPDDFDRILLRTKLWRTSSLFPLIGGIQSSDWIYVNEFRAGNYPGYFRFFGGGLNIVGIANAEVSVGDSVRTEYVNRNWVRPIAGGDRSDTFQSDTDLTVVPERIVRLGLLWRWLEAKGLPYAEPLATYEDQLELAISADRNPLPFSLSAAAQFGDYDNDTLWPGNVTPR